MIQIMHVVKALYAPSFPHNIFSVKASTQKGARFFIGGGSGMMLARDGTGFPISSRHGLYFLNSGS